MSVREPPRLSSVSLRPHSRPFLAACSTCFGGRARSTWCCRWPCCWCMRLAGCLAVGLAMVTFGCEEPWESGAEVTKPTVPTLARRRGLFRLHHRQPASQQPGPSRPSSTRPIHHPSPPLPILYPECLSPMERAVRLPPSVWSACVCTTRRGAGDS